MAKINGITMIACYISPNIDIQTYHSKQGDIFNSTYRHDEDEVVLGDFNPNSSCGDNHEVIVEERELGSGRLIKECWWPTIGIPLSGEVKQAHISISPWIPLD
ncbi:hypothetical protein HHI36_019748 [Cryptolaemus montrouzieri]|uniref:Uncharacterized protein n=1 Tax=Cryptolaemus montrouzieri TaxID=559131 RepID=A0ABD2N8C4_9CUCU